MIGVDNSGEMLEIAMEKRVRSGRNILYLLPGHAGVRALARWRLWSVSAIP